MNSQTLETNKKIARQFFEYFGKGDINQVEKLLGTNYKFHFPGKPQLNKVEALEIMKAYVSGFPDIKFNVEFQVAEGDLVVTRVTPQATHTGTFQGIPATNKKVSLSGLSTHRIVNGKIEEEWVEFDALGLMTQIGAVAEPAHTQY